MQNKFFYTRSDTEIMVVDSLPQDLQLLSELLGRTGFPVTSLTSGELALASLETRLPQLILTETRLDGISGYDFCEQVKTNPRTAGISVIFVSSHGEPHEKLQGFAAGAVDYLTKPYQDREMLARVHTHLNSLNLYKRLTQSAAAMEELNAALEEEIAEKTALAETLAQTAEELQDLYDNAPCGYHALDAAGRFTRINATELSWLGYTREELIGYPVAMILSPAGAETFRRNFPAFMKQGRVKDLEMEFLRRDGSILPVEVNATAIYHADGSYLSSRSTVIDITERKEAEVRLRAMNESLEQQVAERTAQIEAMYGDLRSINMALAREIDGHLETERLLSEAKEAAENANKAKSQFLANMSHEIRTPLNGLIGMIELMLTTALSEEQQEYISLEKRSALALLTIINDVMDYSRIESGILRVEREPLDVRGVLRDVMALFDPSLRQKHLASRIQVAESLPPLVLGDAVRLKQVLSNLIGNAVKFTQAGHIEATAEMTPAGDALLFRVADTGIGVPETMRETIFERFRQLDSSYAKTYQGAGLGLAISRKLVALMGGRIWAEPRPGGGSVFCFTLPCQPADGVAGTRPSETAPKPLAGSDPSGRRILIVEDDPTSGRVIENLLSRYGCRAKHLDSGQKALAHLADQPADLVLMDIQMPELDGVETTRLLKGAFPAGGRPPVIAMTAYAMPGDRERFLAEGFDDYISKPVILNDLLELIRKWLPDAPR